MIVVGIDPGRNTGLAVWSTDRLNFDRVESMPLHEAMNEVRLLHEGTRELATPTHAPLLVVFEDARLRRWFGKMDREQAKYGAAVREGAGAAKRDARVWEDFLKSLSVPYVARAPTRTKWPASYFAATAKWTGRTNEHGRDAGALVVGVNTPMALAMVRGWEQLRANEQRPRTRGRRASTPAHT